MLRWSVIASCVAIGFVTLADAPRAQRSTTPDLAITLLDEGREIALLLPEVTRVRRRTGHLSSTFIDAITGTRRPVISRVTLNLFPNVVLSAVFDRSETVGRGLVWVGRIEGEPLSLVTLAVVDRELTGTITHAGGTYEIEGAADGSVTVAEVDESRLAPPGEPLRRPSRATPSPEASGASIDGPIRPAALRYITIAVFFTTRAQNEGGGLSRMLSRVAGRIATANTVYKNSGINQRLTLVHSGPISYAQSGSPYTDLSRLAGNGDRYMDAVHTTRNSKRADLVALIVGGSSWSQGACGLAYIFTAPLTTWFASAAFSWTVLECLPVYAFEHELGHNMGAHHDSYVTNGAHGAFTYSHGYVDVIGRFRTIMSYANRCPTCWSTPYFSNPNKLHGTRPLGTASANNALTLNNTAAIVAAFR